jgi:hypothetical protein
MREDIELKRINCGVEVGAHMQLVGQAAHLPIAEFSSGLLRGHCLTVFSLTSSK